MISDYYTETAVIYSISTSVGWNSEPQWTAGATVSAAINPSAGNERIAAGKETVFVNYKMYCSDTVSITEANRVVYAGSTFDVVFVKDTLNMGHHKVVYLVSP